MGFLREADAGLSVKGLCWRHVFPEASYYPWRSKVGGMSVSDAKRLKELEIGRHEAFSLPDLAIDGIHRWRKTRRHRKTQRCRRRGHIRPSTTATPAFLRLACQRMLSEGFFRSPE